MNNSAALHDLFNINNFAPPHCFIYYVTPLSSDVNVCRPFAVKGPRLWNMLPQDLILADYLKSFKTNLDRLLLSLRDTPLSLVMRHRSLTHCWTDQGKETTECCQADDCRVRWPSGSLTLPFQRYSKV